MVLLKCVEIYKFDEYCIKNDCNISGSIYKNIVKAFGNVYTPHKELSLDEGIIPWRGNLGFRVYMKDKVY